VADDRRPGGLGHLAFTVDGRVEQFSQQRQAKAEQEAQGGRERDVAAPSRTHRGRVDLGLPNRGDLDGAGPSGGHLLQSSDGHRQLGPDCIGDLSGSPRARVNDGNDDDDGIDWNVD